MKKTLLVILTLFAALTSYAVDIPKGTIYFDNSVTKFNTVRFAYGPETSKGTVLVTMKNEGNDIWSYTFTRQVRDMYRYI